MTKLTIKLLARRGLIPLHFKDKDYKLFECSTGAIFVIPQKTNGVPYDYLMIFFKGKKYSVGLYRLLVKLIRARTRTMATILHDNYEETKRAGVKLGAVVKGSALIWTGGANGFY